jgi:hypothetical protein
MSFCLFVVVSTKKRVLYEGKSQIIWHWGYISFANMCVLLSDSQNIKLTKGSGIKIIAKKSAWSYCQFAAVST